MIRHSVLKLLAAAVVTAGLGAQLRADDIPSLKDAYKGHFLIGTAIDFTGNNLSPEEIAMIKQQYNEITPENSMKPGPIHPQENTYNWETPDRLVAFGQENHIQIVGHNLAWHSQNAAWMFSDNPTKEKAIERLHEHIKTVVGRYKGKLKGWDVVNEAINDGGDAETAKTENLRTTSPYYRAIGPEFLTLAFKFAREADPTVELNYNDYNIEKGPKHQSSLVLLKRLKADGADVQVVGIQGHWSLTGAGVPFDDIDKAISDYAALGLKVAISELDITMAGNAGGQLNQGGFGGAGGAGGAPGGRRGGRGAPPAPGAAPAAPGAAPGAFLNDSRSEIERVFAAYQPASEQLYFVAAPGAAPGAAPAAGAPPAAGAAGAGRAGRGGRGAGAGGGRGGRGGAGGAPPSPEQLKAQADAYAHLFQIFEKHKDTINRVTLWGLNDARSWRSGQNPLVFDRENKPKPAFFAIIDVAKGPPAPK